MRQGQNNNPTDNAIIKPPQTKAKKKIDNLKPEHFEKRNGIRQLYRMISSKNLDGAERNVRETMKKIVVTLKTWQFNMMPRYTDSYFFQRAQALGENKTLQAYMNKVRRIHKGKEKWTQEEGGQTVAPNRYDDSINMIDNMGEGRRESAFGEEDEDNEFMEIMAKMDAQTKKLQPQAQQPYIPEGFDFDYQEHV